MEQESNKLQKYSGYPSLACVAQKVTTPRASSTESVEHATKSNMYFLFLERKFKDLFTKYNGKTDGLGTFTGVLIPTCENMWGVLIFLRFFYIVGNAGVWQTFIIVSLSFLCALLTTTSLCAIATNGPIEEGGTYFLLSRALGPQIGGAVGFMYFLGLLLLAVLETLGAVEVMQFTFTILNFPSANRVLGVIVVLLLGIMVFFGIKFVSKLGTLFFAVVLYTLLSYLLGLTLAPPRNAQHSLTGLSWNTFRGNWNPGYRRGASFSVMVSVFFPCFTGILSGADRAKNLQRPERSIPVGTLGAVVVSLFLYLLYFVLWGAVGTREYLLGEYPSNGQTENAHSENNKLMAVRDVAYPIEILTQLGIIVTSISQALQCLITAPRVLQAIAGDGIIPMINSLGKASACGEPKRALILTTILGMMAAMAGSLDHIAPVVSICFLTCYSALNCSCFLLSIVNAPSWRPKWKYYHWSFALVGLVMCLAMNFVILWYWALIAIFMLLAICAYIYDRQVEVDWGTGLGGLWLQLSVQSLLCVGQEAHYSVNWRPQLLCLLKPRRTRSKRSHSEPELLSFASHLKKGKGLCIVTTILEGRIEELTEKSAEHKVKLENSMQAAGLTGFARVLVAQSYRQAKSYIIQSSGIGSLEPNTVLLGWPKKWRHDKHKDRAPIFVETLVECKAADKAVLICMNMCDFPVADTSKEGKLDIWWMVHDGGLLLMLAHVIQRHEVWRKCKLRVCTISAKLDNSALIKKNLKKLLEQVRINAEVEVLELEDSVRMEEAKAFDDKFAEYRKTQAVAAFNSMDHRIGKADVTRAAERNSFDMKAELHNTKALQEIIKHAFPGKLSLLRCCSHVPRCTTGHNSRADLHPDPCYPDIELQENCDSLQCSNMHVEPHQNELVLNEADDTEVRYTQCTLWNEKPLRHNQSGNGAVTKCCNLEVVVEDHPKNELNQKKKDTLQNLQLPLKEIHDIVDIRSAGQPHPATYHEALQMREDSSSNNISKSSAGQLYPGSHLSFSKAPDTPRRNWGSLSQSYSAKALNELIVEHSRDAQLVLLNLPDHYQGMQPCEYMEYCESLTKGLERVILVSGTGKELWAT
ncbi:hypothetical protein O6H91_03G106500 [Diphasiastrum complanatum]|uniref:Uncharacterized protein n=3 Tax=Diphasiastrum complanatum TaxID=34168 RepID=A0ACC2EA27_DIPCM|nr:hypothetical protein O6H91_03G106500 [Diphasiastrum complanatum]KAJ7563354.1 hypothetical protein O6H91_03G106500 [Diphasiastrum complanatum]KAJ7563356.1 hypothetical protein O6H91_03G106500 [Diphasiastrum complanatum]